MPSEIIALHRELDDSLTHEQMEEQEENFEMCKAEEEDAYNEFLEFDELQEKDQGSKILEYFINNENINLQYDDDFIEILKTKELILMAKNPRSGQPYSGLNFAIGFT